MNVKDTEDMAGVLQLVQERAVDIILMDVSLCRSHYQGQVYDGIDITQLLKQNPQTADVPVVLVTAHAMTGDKKKLLSTSGAEGYIAKPVVDPAAFVSEIQALVKKPFST